MKTRILSLLMTVALLGCLLPAGSLSVQAAFPEGIRSNGLPVLNITINTSLTKLHQSKNNAATDGQVTLYTATGQQQASVRLEQMKGRGNASWAMAGDKRSYNIKCVQPVELISGAGAGKNWVLVANNVTFATADRTGLGNLMAQTLYQQMGGASALSCQPVDLYITEGTAVNYRGTYLLLEKVEIQKNRVNITKADMTMDENFDHVRYVNKETTNLSAGEQALVNRGISEFRYAPGSKVKSDGGFILEADNRYLHNNHDHADKGAGSFFVTSHGAQIVIKEPEFVTLAQLTKVATFVQDMEDALYNRTGYNAAGKYYTDYLDLSSTAKRVLLDCLTGQLDVFKTSCYFYIDGDNNGLKGKLIAGPAWDYDNLHLEEKKLYSTADKTWNAGARNWFAQLMTKGGFVDLLYDMNKDMLSPMASKMANETLAVFRQQQMASQNNSDLLWKSAYDREHGRDFPTLSLTFINRFKQRVNCWQNAVWTPDKLMGVTLSVKGGTITAHINGTGTYEWCRVDEKDPSKYVSLGKTTSTFTPSEKGAYFVVARGASLGDGHRYGGGTNGVAGVVMYSSVAHIGCIHSLDAVAATPANCWESGTAAYWTCKLCGTLFADNKGEVTISAPKATAPTGRHDWDAGKVTLPAASDDTGVYTYNCKNCTATKIRTLPKDPSAPPREVAVQTQQGNIIIGNASQGTVIKPGSADSSMTGQTSDGSVILAPGTSMEDVVDPTPSGTTTVPGTTDSTALPPGETAPNDGDGTNFVGTVVTRPGGGTAQEDPAAEESSATEMIILIVAVAACLGVLIPLTIMALRAKKKQAALDAAYEEALQNGTLDEEE